MITLGVHLSIYHIIFGFLSLTTRKKPVQRQNFFLTKAINWYWKKEKPHSGFFKIETGALRMVA